MYGEDKIKQYVIQDITYTRERAKKIIDDWQPKKDETGPKFILSDLILKDYEALDKLIGERLEPTEAEIWLSKRGNVEPKDWLVSYKTWKDTV